MTCVSNYYYTLLWCILLLCCTVYVSDIVTLSSLMWWSESVEVAVHWDCWNHFYSQLQLQLHCCWRFCCILAESLTDMTLSVKQCVISCDVNRPVSEQSCYIQLYNRLPRYVTETISQENDEVIRQSHINRVITTATFNNSLRPSNSSLWHSYITLSISQMQCNNHKYVIMSQSTQAAFQRRVLKLQLSQFITYIQWESNAIEKNDIKNQNHSVLKSISDRSQ